ncbi:hypothetical protein MMSR116_17385 [Methylobacterium mesophilicum SR1.6/6]|uniref:Uncharacterized protein n=1 Tax=Methylobacterium mesophilicum SR1.6/6 TaxID=908290 RepID=A0A6B9FLM4_9HYPH|nr:hypothetical protein [Methylobacterium mesophilicum]QGY03470.1 hypothetical protein MMSR116_17385 [Methylobacterium mesophilicum SR1.6/6]
MRIREVLAAVVRPHPGQRGGTGRPLPVRIWPDDAALWLDENGVRHRRAARHVLASLAALRHGGRYGARVAGTGKVVTGPVSVLTLRDPQDECGFVFCLTPCGHGEEHF